ncbi:MAG: DUF5947 family protein [Blastocatellia bacterium]
MDSLSSATDSAFATLRRFARSRAPVEQCDFCNAELAAAHQHLLEPEQRRLHCICRACAILFSSQGETKYRRVPERARALPDFQLTDEQWESLLIPISLAFFFRSSAADKIIALYPSPAGPTEAMPDPATWAEIVRANPQLQELEPDVEALLVNRVGSAREYFIAPMDECFRLVGLVRARWRGLSGGAEVWEEIRQFFAELKQRSATTQEAWRA